MVGRSAETIERGDTAPLSPLGVARNWFAVSPPAAEREIAGVVVGLRTEAVNQEGTLLTETVVTVPIPGPTEDHVPSPRQNVEDDAPVPEFKFETLRFPETSVARLTAEKLGGAPPCKTCDDVPLALIVAMDWSPPPSISELEVSEEAEVTQVGQEIALTRRESGELKVNTFSFPENVDQSELLRTPVFVADEIGKLSV